jgi:hypothetical protein
LHVRRAGFLDDEVDESEDEDNKEPQSHHLLSLGLKEIEDMFFNDQIWGEGPNLPHFQLPTPPSQEHGN